MKFCIQRLLQGQYVRTTDLNRVLALKSVPSVVIVTFDGREVAAVIDEVALNDDTTDNINPITGPEP